MEEIAKYIYVALISISNGLSDNILPSYTKSFLFIMCSFIFKMKFVSKNVMEGYSLILYKSVYTQ